MSAKKLSSAIAATAAMLPVTAEAATEAQILRLLLLSYLFLNPKNNSEQIPTTTKVCAAFEHWKPGQIPFDFGLDIFFSPRYLKPTGP